MKAAFFLGDSRKQVLKFQVDPRREAGYQLGKVQQGSNPSDWKPMPTVGENMKTATDTNDKLLIEKSPGNLFADLGFPPAESANLALRSECMMALENWYHTSGLTQVTAAKQLGITQPRLNAMLKGAIGQFSLDALVNMASSAGLAVKLSLKEQGKAKARKLIAA